MATSQDIFNINACVSCPMCSSEIPLPGGLRLPRQFSVPCPNCGSEKFTAWLRFTIERRTPHGVRRIFVQPKSRRSEGASWLRQQISVHE
jgi:hypothetical protein